MYIVHATFAKNVCALTLFEVGVEDAGNFNIVVQDGTRNLVLNFIHDDNHFINEFL